jgi:hypothetical protein
MQTTKKKTTTTTNKDFGKIKKKLFFTLECRRRRRITVASPTLAVRQEQTPDLPASNKNIDFFLKSQAHRTPFSRADRVKHFQTVGVPRAGMYHIDYGKFHKDWSGSNKGFTGFLVAVENFTNQLFVEPCKGKGTNEWLRAIQNFVELTRNVAVIFSDRDSVATSTAFCDGIAAKYKIEWNFLKNSNKSYLAERYIGLVKSRLSQTLNYRGGKKWIHLVPAFVVKYNKEKIDSTSYSCQSVSPTNFLHFISQLLRVDNPELGFNGFKVGSFVTERWNKIFFKFNLGDRVVVARAANWKDGNEKLGQFKKVSMLGGFGHKIYTISGRQLRSTKARDRYVEVYSLAEFGSSMHFYAKELRLAGGGSNNNNNNNNNV